MVKEATKFYRVMLLPFGEADKSGKKLTDNTLSSLIKAVELHNRKSFDIIVVSGGKNNAANLMKTWLWEKKVRNDIMFPEDKSEDLFDSVERGLAKVDQMMRSQGNAKSNFTVVADSWTNRAVSLMMAGVKISATYENSSAVVPWKRVFKMIAYSIAAISHPKGKGFLAGIIRAICG